MDKIHHIAIQVDNIKDSVAFYTKSFECCISYQDDTWAMIDFENTSLALVLPEQHPYHFAILTEDIDQYGQPVLHRDGTKSVYINDNSGNKVEMITIPNGSN